MSMELQIESNEALQTFLKPREKIHNVQPFDNFHNAPT